MTRNVRKVINFVDANYNTRESWTADSNGVILACLMSDDGWDGHECVSINNAHYYAYDRSHDFARGTPATSNLVDYCILCLPVYRGDVVSISSDRAYSSGPAVDLEHGFVVFLAS